MTKSEIIRWDNTTPEERAAIKVSCETSFEAFLRFFFQLLQGQKFLWNWHHAYFCSIAEDVFYGRKNRVIINCPPGSTKTELWSIHFPAWGAMRCSIAGRPSRWLPISYSDDLVRENSGRVKDIILSEPYQAMWPMEISRDTRGKSDWKFSDKKGNEHRMYGTSLMGQVTGRRAGYMINGKESNADDEKDITDWLDSVFNESSQKTFTGALIIDDPLPPRDEGGKVMSKSNTALNRIVRSRLAQDDTPIVMIQQRIGNGDSTDHLMGDKSPDTYELFKVPGVIDNSYVLSHNKEVKEMIVADTGFDGARCSYWPRKEPTATLLDIEKSDAFLFSSQYQQAPDEAMLEGVIYRKEIERAVEEGRICRIPIERSLPVYTYWDLGISKGNEMNVWLMQPYKLDLRLIAFYGKNNHDGIGEFINWLIEFKQKYGIVYAKHYAPHDVEARNVMTGKSDMDTAHELGIDFVRVPRVKVKQNSISALRKLWPRIWIDPERCDVDAINGEKVRGYEALRKYHREYDPDLQVFREAPCHDWTSNPSDALQQLGLSWSDPKPPRPALQDYSAGWMG